MLNKLIGPTDTLNRATESLPLQSLQNRTPEATGQDVVLHRNNELRTFSRSTQHLNTERLDESGINDSGTNPVLA